MGAPVPAFAELVSAGLVPTGDAVRAALVASLASADKPTAERAARTLKRISEADRAILHPHRKALLRAALAVSDVRVQWNLSIVIGRLPLTGRDRDIAIDLMYERLGHPSGLNRTLAMQALVDLSESDRALRSRILPILRDALENGTPAMQARAKRLLKSVR